MPTPVDPQLLRDRLREARAENLMILYVDSRRRDARQTPFYYPEPGNLGRRENYANSFLQQSDIRRLILQEFEAAVRWHATQHPPHWDTMRWLRDTFPDRHITPTNPPGEALTELRQIIDRWNHLAGVVEARRAFDRAVTTLKAELRDASNQREWNGVFGSEASRGVGGTSHGVQSVEFRAAGWATGLLRYLQTINELRRGQQPSRSGTISGAGRVFSAVMVDAARRAWNGLTRDQRSFVAHSRYWPTVVSELWTELKARLTWALRQAGANQNADSLDNGAWRHPRQDLTR
jgi:hypothetical protein